jgi:hypothetical protein
MSILEMMDFERIDRVVWYEANNKMRIHYTSGQTDLVFAAQTVASQFADDLGLRRVRGAPGMAEWARLGSVRHPGKKSWIKRILRSAA